MNIPHSHRSNRPLNVLPIFRGFSSFRRFSTTLHSSALEWPAFEPREKKGTPSYDSFLSKIVKIGIVSSCMGAALHKSCIHSMSASLDNPASHLEKASGKR